MWQGWKVHGVLKDSIALIKFFSPIGLFLKTGNYLVSLKIAFISSHNYLSVNFCHLSVNCLSLKTHPLRIELSQTQIFMKDIYITFLWYLRSGSYLDLLHFMVVQIYFVDFSMFLIIHGVFSPPWEADNAYETVFLQGIEITKLPITIK